MKHTERIETIISQVGEVGHTLDALAKNLRTLQMHVRLLGVEFKKLRADTEAQFEDGEWHGSDKAKVE